MIPQIYQTLEGEVLRAQKRREGDGVRILYICQATLPSGQIVRLHNVEQASLLGGIGDYQRRRLRTRDDGDYKPQNSLEQANLNASVGEKVYITFIGGNIYKPVIIGYKQHTNQVDDVVLKDGGESDIASVQQYNGIREVIDQSGNYRFVRKGAPEVKFAPQGGAGDLLGAAVALAGALGGLGGSSGDTVFDGDQSPALEAKGPEQRLVVEILDNALYRVRDPEGAVLELNHTGKQGVFLSDNDFKSSEDVDESSSPASGGLVTSDPGSTDAEFIWLNRSDQLVYINARDTINIHTANLRKDNTDQDYFHTIGNNSTTEIAVDEIVTISGNSTHSVEGDRIFEIIGSYNNTVDADYSLAVEGATSIVSAGAIDIETQDAMSVIAASGYTLTTDGDFSVTAQGDVVQESSTGNVAVTASAGDITLVAAGQASLNLSGGQVALGGASAELLDLFDQTLDEMNKILTALQSQTHIGNLGIPTSPPVNAANYASSQAKVATIKSLLGSIKGSL